MTEPHGDREETRGRTGAKPERTANMSMRKVGLLVTAVVAVAVIVFVMRWASTPSGAVAQAQQQARAVSVEVATSVKKSIPVRIEALGSVTPIASVAIKPRVDSEITEVRFADGAQVNKGDILLVLDSRAIEAQIAQAQGNLARDQAQLAGAQRDFNRYTDLVSKGATPVINLDNARTQVGTFSAAVQADEASLQNLKVQLSYCTIAAPISGRISAAAVKIGNFVRSADVAPIATLIQTAPIYVTFPVPQGGLPALRAALSAQTAVVRASAPGEIKAATGQVTMIENSVDATTGTVIARATMPNTDELLWPGTLVNVALTLREEEAITVPSAAVRVSQSGSFVFVVKDGKAVMRPVTVARTVDSEAALSSGLEAGEMVVTDGHLLLTNGALVAIRDRQARNS
jgi:multidrug efflux system membrane fusion protein